MENRKENSKDNTTDNRNDNLTIKRTKFFISIMKEKLWLEQMAIEGFRLVRMTMGIRYTFEKIGSAKLVYEIDRFDLPKNPTLSQIKSKEDSLEMAKEMGWEVLFHDEDMNYYFCKEAVEGEDNELYNDQDSRNIHAEKYRSRYLSLSNGMLIMMLIVDIAGLLVGMILGNGADDAEKFSRMNQLYLIFVVGYSAICVILLMMYNKMADFYYKEFLVTKDEWLAKNDYLNSNSKKERKIFFRASTFKKYLEKNARDGWYPQKISYTGYSFIKGEMKEYDYIMDSKYLTNKRMTAAGSAKINDPKDLAGAGNDWQIQSVKDAEALGWEFVCAFQNKSILYRAPKSNNVEQLNTGGKMPLVGILSCKTSIYMVLCMGFGAIIGFVWAMITL